MTTRTTKRHLSIALAIGILGLAGCSATGEEAPGDVDADLAQEEAPAEEPRSDSEGDDGSDEPVVNSAFDGDAVAFSEIHCATSPGNDGRMRLLALYDEGEIQIDAVDDGVNIVLEMGDEATYYSRDANGIDFEDGSAQGDVEVSNADDDVITVGMDLAC